MRTDPQEVLAGRNTGGDYDLDVWWTPDCGHLHLARNPVSVSMACPDGARPEGAMRMSVVTTVVLITDGEIEPYCAAIQRFEWDGRIANMGDEIDPCGNLVGGSKCAESDVRIAAFNHLPWDAFIAHLEQIEWRPYDQVVVVLQSCDLSATRVWEWVGGAGD